jgi:mannose-1-phosphate guanylyltransferase
MLIPVLLSGGDGTRLWPASRASLPKQFVNLTNPNKSLLQSTAERINSLTVNHSGWYVVANDEHRFLVAEQLSQINVPVEKIILEPVARNTAPAIALAAIEALKTYPTAKLLIQTADHIIPDLNYLNEQVLKAMSANQSIVTFGIKPNRPETGYGYIKIGKKIDKTYLYNVEKFIEKPDLKSAKEYINQNNFLWNSGMFLIDATIYLEELNKFEPEIFIACQNASEESIVDLDFIRVNKESFSKSPSKSIDFAVIEHSQKVSVIPYSAQWTDLGAWDAVFENLPVDHNGNSIIGEGILYETTKTMVKSENRLVVTLGVDDLLIVETPDVVLVTKKEAAQKVKDIVSDLKNRNFRQASEHTTVYRPWGSYQSLYRSKNSQVKKIKVKPKKSLSLQLHHHRSEHWVVVKGTAEIIKGKQNIILNENESTFIPTGTKHRLTNTGEVDLVLIEVQLGMYLGEDDIVRFKDEYGRV